MKIDPSSAVDGWANGRRIPDTERASEEFEAFLVAEVWKQSQRGVRWSDLLGDGSTTRMMNEMWIDEIVGQASRARSLGLAESLNAAKIGKPESSG